MFQECVIGAAKMHFEEDPEFLKKEVSRSHCQKAEHFDVETCLATNSWWTALSKVEQTRVHTYRALWEDKFGSNSLEDDRAIFVLTNNPDEFAAMSNSKGVHPCFTTGNNRCWKDNLSRWTSQREKFNGMGFPILPSTAQVVNFS